MESINEISKQYINDIHKYTVLSDIEFNELFVEAKKGNKDAYDKIVLHNLCLVVTIAKQYANIESSLDFMDLIMEGNIGLYKAIDYFDPNQGIKFSTYAWQWIQRYISIALCDKGRIIRVPANIHNHLKKYKHCINDWVIENGTDTMPSKEYVMNYIPALTNETYTYLTHAYNLSIIDTLNRPLTDEIDDADELINVIPDTNKSVSAELEHEELVQIIDETIERFVAKNKTTKERTKDILHRRFGLKGRKEETLQSIATSYGVTREAIRKIEVRFIKFCQTGYNRNVLARYY